MSLYKPTSSDSAGWKCPPASSSLIDFPLWSRFEGTALPVTSLVVLDRTQLCAWLPPSNKCGLLIFFPECFELSERTREPYLFICLTPNETSSVSPSEQDASALLLYMMQVCQKVKMFRNTRSLKLSEMSWGNKKCDILFNFLLSCLLCCSTSQIQ